MRIAFIFGSPKISGGSYVIFQHAAYLKEKGHQVHLVTLKKIALKPEDIWHDAMRNLDFISISEAAKNQYDICIATWWMSPFHLHKLNAKQYSYFVQSIEAYFSEDADISNQYLASLFSRLRPIFLKMQIFLINILLTNHTILVFLLSPKHCGLRKIWKSGSIRTYFSSRMVSEKIFIARTAMSFVLDREMDCASWLKGL